MFCVTILTAHSGADGLPDNSLAFVHYALASDADALEVDVRRAPDGELHLGHDAAECDLPSLAEVFALLRKTPAMRINCDLKEPELEEAVCELAHQAGLEGRVILTGTVDAERYAASPGMRRTADLWINIEEVVPGIYSKAQELTVPRLLEAADQVLAVCRRLRLYVVNVHYLLAVPPFAERLSGEGVRLSVWTVNEEEDIRHFLAEDVYALTTRSLAAALRARKQLNN